MYGWVGCRSVGAYPFENVLELLVGQAVVDELDEAEVAEALDELDGELALGNGVTIEELVEVEGDELVF